MYEPILCLFMLAPAPTMADVRQAYYEVAYEQLFATNPRRPSDGVLEMAGSKYWEERVEASRLLQWADIRFAMRGYLSLDQEVRWRCDSVLVRRTPCYDCLDLSDNDYYTCQSCNSGRSTWLGVKE